MWARLTTAEARRLAGSLASCVAFYARRYLLRHGLDRAAMARVRS